MPGCATPARAPCVVSRLRGSLWGHRWVIVCQPWAYMVCHGAVRGLTGRYRVDALAMVSACGRVRLPFVVVVGPWALPGCAGLSWGYPVAITRLSINPSC